MIQDYKNLFSLEGKRALVTGGAQGLGLAIAEAFCAAGAAVTVADINAEAVKAAAEGLSAEGGKAFSVTCDVSKEEQVAQAVNTAAELMGGLDIVVANAGVSVRAPAEEMTLDQWNKVIDIDLTAPFIVSKAVLPGMLRKGHGKIINVCSMLSEVGRETVAAYTAAKGGLKMLTKNIASEFGGRNIQCNGIGPGYIATPQTAPLRTPGHPFNAFILSKTPAHRWGTPEDLMGPAVFLASDASDFVNGHILYVDGGILAYLGRNPQG